MALNNGELNKGVDEFWFIKIMKNIPDFYIDTNGPQQIKNIMSGFITGNRRAVKNDYLGFYYLYINYLNKLPYREYLKTGHWKSTRYNRLKLSGFSCEVCGAKGVKLNVHHRTYKTRGNESQNDLAVLCELCHGDIHKK